MRESIRRSSILDCIPEFQGAIEHASIVGGKTRGRRRKGPEVEPSEAVIVEELVSNNSEGGPNAIGRSRQGFFGRNGAIGDGGWSHETWLG